MRCGEGVTRRRWRGNDAEPKRRERSQTVTKVTSSPLEKQKIWLHVLPALKTKFYYK